MVLYFTGTGNSLAVARKIAAATGDSLLPLAEAAGTDLTAETSIGLVYPCYDFNTPPAVRDLVDQLQISPSAYLFIVVTCGAQTGNSVWTVRRILRRKGVRVAYCHKIRMPDNSATLFGRNPNDQLWKLEKYAPRLQRIVDDVRARRRANHFGAPGLAGCLTGIPAVERKLLGGFKPQVNPDLCIGCGLCVKTCPISNISMVSAGGTPALHKSSSHAAIGTACTACLGCLHVCPQQAIQVAGKPVPKERQYRHPDSVKR